MLSVEEGWRLWVSVRWLVAGSRRERFATKPRGLLAGKGRQDSAASWIFRFACKPGTRLGGHNWQPSAAHSATHGSGAPKEREGVLAAGSGCKARRLPGDQSAFPTGGKPDRRVGCHAPELLGCKAAAARRLINDSSTARSRRVGQTVAIHRHRHRRRHRRPQVLGSGSAAGPLGASLPPSAGPATHASTGADARSRRCVACPTRG